MRLLLSLRDARRLRISDAKFSEDKLSVSFNFAVNTKQANICTIRMIPEDKDENTCDLLFTSEFVSKGKLIQNDKGCIPNVTLDQVVVELKNILIIVDGRKRSSSSCNREILL